MQWFLFGVHPCGTIDFAFFILELRFFHKVDD